MRKREATTRDGVGISTRRGMIESAVARRQRRAGSLIVTLLATPSLLLMLLGVWKRIRLPYHHPSILLWTVVAIIGALLTLASVFLLPGLLKTPDDKGR